MSRPIAYLPPAASTSGVSAATHGCRPMPPQNTTQRNQKHSQTHDSMEDKLPPRTATRSGHTHHRNQCTKQRYRCPTMQHTTHYTVHPHNLHTTMQHNLASPQHQAQTPTNKKYYTSCLAITHHLNRSLTHLSSIPLPPHSSSLTPHRSF